MKPSLSFQRMSRFRFAALPVLFFLLASARNAFPASVPQTFTDSDGDIYTVRLAGPGFNTLSCAGGLCWAAGTEGRIARLSVPR